LNLDISFASSASEELATDKFTRRSGVDRRNAADRRQTGGLFQVRARRGGPMFDRRRGERRERSRPWLAFLRRSD
jgi:hypothetical protein